MGLFEEIQHYKPWNEQEACDREQMLWYMEHNTDYLMRENKTAHFTASIWTVNRKRTKTLMVYHNIYKSWSWIGGHADGDGDLRAVALRELREETGVADAVLVKPGIFSLEILTVDGHRKNGVYVPSHLHLNVTYLAEAKEGCKLVVNEAENQAVKWWPLEEVQKVSTEAWFVEWVYKKLIARCQQDMVS